MMLVALVLVYLELRVMSWLVAEVEEAPTLGTLRAGAAHPPHTERSRPPAQTTPGPAPAGGKSLHDAYVKRAQR